MYGTWCEACVIPEKLTVKIGNNGRQHSSPAVPGALQYFCYQGCIARCYPAPSVFVLSLLNQDIGQLFRDAKPIRTILEALEGCNTRFTKGHKPSNHIHARIKSHLYTTE